MYSDDDILKGAHLIRHKLDELVGENASEIDHRLAELLEKAKRGEKVGNQILELFAQEGETRTWIKEFLDGTVPNLTRSFEQLPGITGPVPTKKKYVCPECDFKWHQRMAIEPIPECPIHHVPLILEDES